jgi:hypothetical protein
MAAAAVISFEETRQSFAKTRARQQLHAYLDGWLERHCQLNRTPLYSPSIAWHTCPMNAAPRVRRALSSYQ